MVEVLADRGGTVERRGTFYGKRRRSLVARTEISTIFFASPGVPGVSVVTAVSFPAVHARGWRGVRFGIEVEVAP